MPAFSYTALTAQGTPARGESVASSPEALRAELAARGLLVQSIRAKRASGPRLGRARAEEFLVVVQEFTALVRAGLTIPESLALICERPDHPRLGQTLARVLEDVRGGAILSEACARHPETFDALFVSSLKTGERTGDLAGVLERYRDYLRRRVALQKKVSQALAYPVFLLVTLAVILLVLFVFVLPRFVGIYADFNAELPLATRLLIGFVDRLPLIAPLLAGAAALGWFALRRYAATADGRLRIDRWKERLPLLGEVTRTASAAQLARSLSTLLAGGTPLVEAMRTVEQSLQNLAIRARLRQATDLVTEGKPAAEALRTAGLMPGTAVRMVEVGEASGRLDAMLAEVAGFYEERLEGRLARLMALIEPMLMLLVGVFVGGIIVTMYLPIFHLADVIK
jgi:type IV pilus assembly protein PilC